MSSEKTINYSMHKWVGSDSPMRAEFNENFEKIDTEIKSHATSLADIVQQFDRPLMKNGNVYIPNDFLQPNFKIDRIGKYDYKHTADPYNVFDWTDAIEIFIDCFSKYGTDGTNSKTPITLFKFKMNLDEGIYGSSNKFVLSFLNTFYITDKSTVFNNNVNILFRSMSPTNFTWIGRIKRQGIETTTFEYDGLSNLYKSTLLIGTTHIIKDVINFITTDSFGMPQPYQKVSTLSECQALKGSFYQNNETIYVNLYTYSDLLGLTLLVDSRLLDLTLTNGYTVIFDNLGFLAASYSITGNINSRFYCFNSKFYRGYDDAFSITGKYRAFLFDCVAAYGSKDGFNYHSAQGNATYVYEINCISYGNGKYKLLGGNTTTHSNNGSTAHDGMRIMRVGGKYWDCEGPIVADADDCYSISIGCQVGNCLLTTTGKKAGFYVYDTSGVEPLNKKYFIECLANGKNLEYGFFGTDDTYVLDIEGNSNTSGNLKQLDSWEV